MALDADTVDVLYYVCYINCGFCLVVVPSVSTVDHVFFTLHVTGKSTYSCMHNSSARQVIPTKVVATRVTRSEQMSLMAKGDGCVGRSHVDT